MERAHLDGGRVEQQPLGKVGKAGRVEGHQVLAPARKRLRHAPTGARRLLRRGRAPRRVLNHPATPLGAAATARQGAHTSSARVRCGLGSLCTSTSWRTSGSTVLSGA